MHFSKVSYESLWLGLDQLYLMPLTDTDTIHTRSIVIDKYIEDSGWSWDAIIQHLIDEPVAEYPVLN